ncbi:MAG: permease, partial [Polyangiaceae bacterium]
MIAGHFGLAAAVKSRVPTAPTWALMLASVWMDVLFVPLFLAGVETIEPFGGGDGQGYGAAVIHADLTHSLLGALVIAATFGLVCAIAWGKKLGAVMGAVVFSHWALDLPMHHHDMPLLPENAGHLPLLGFGLWSLP